MDRRELEQHLRAHGSEFQRHGGRHDIWINRTTRKTATVPRHSPIKRGTVRSICKKLSAPLPPGF